MRMEAEDLIEKAKDIQMLRVTKDLQQRLMEENVAAKDQNEIETLEKTLELSQKVRIYPLRLGTYTFTPPLGTCTFTPPSRYIPTYCWYHALFVLCRCIVNQYATLTRAYTVFKRRLKISTPPTLDWTNCC